eukprot:101836_1
MPVANFSIQAQYAKCSYYGSNSTPTTPVESLGMTSSVWADIDVKQNDIFIATAPKSGTTWVSEIVGQLLYNKDCSEINTVMHSKTIWPEMKLTTSDKCNEQIKKQRNESDQSRVVFKTHLPVESLYFRNDCKYLFVGRDFRDTIWSMHNHMMSLKDEMYAFVEANYEKLPVEEKAKYRKPFRPHKDYTAMDLWNDIMSNPDLFGNPDGGWLELSFLWIVGSWWNIQNLPNIKAIHYNNLKNNTQNEIKSIAQFLDIQINDNEIDKVVELCSLDKMRNNVKGTIQKQVFKDGGASFFHKGTNERWKGKLTDDQINQYKILAARYLDDDGIKWLETGNI